MAIFNRHPFVAAFRTAGPSRVRLVSLLLVALAWPLSAAEANPLRAAFANGTDLVTGEGPLGLVLADLRGIGLTDIVVANADDSTVSVLLGNGDGSFAPKQDVAACDSPRAVAAADLDKDGAIDLIVVCAPLPNEESSSIAVLLGNGDGSFRPSVPYSLEVTAGGGIPEPFTATKVLAGDVNDDGFDDVATVATRSGLVSAGGVRVLLNSGNGGGGALQAVFQADGEESASDFALLDIDGDQTLDIAYAVHSTTEEKYGTGWAFGDGSGHFVNDQFNDLDSHCDEIPNGCNISSAIAVGDMNGDGSSDLVFSGDLGPCVMLASGSTFLPCSFQPSFAEARQLILLSDLSGRRQLDLVSAARHIENGDESKLSVLLGSADATFHAGPILFDAPASDGIRGLVAGDFNSDGLPDIAASLTGGNAVRVWLNVGVEDQTPTADDVELSTLQDESIEGVLAGSQAQGGALTYRIVNNPSHGTLQMDDAARGEFTYVPEQGYFGPDSFTYRVDDGYVESDSATVTITVHSKPIAEDDSIATTEDTAVDGTLQGSDPGGNPLVFSVILNGAKGRAVVTNTATGAFTYTPNQGETGEDTFVFSVSNGFATAAGTMTVLITAGGGGGGGGGGGDGGGGSLDLPSLVALFFFLLMSCFRGIRNRDAGASDDDPVGAIPVRFPSETDSRRDGWTRSDRAFRRSGERG